MFAVPISPLVENFTPSLVTDITTAGEAPNKYYIKYICSRKNYNSDKFIFQSTYTRSTCVAYTAKIFTNSSKLS